MLRGVLGAQAALSVSTFRGRGDRDALGESLDGR